MVWSIAAVVVAGVFALAGWSSRRARPGAHDRQRQVDIGAADVGSTHQLNQSYGGNSPFIL